MRVSVIGTGYVGLVSAVCLTEKGHQVICVDIDRKKVEEINQGVSPIYERGLDELLTKNIGMNLTATTDLTTAVRQTQLSLIAVGTPFDGEEIDLNFLKIVSKQIGDVLRNKDEYHVVVVKSTVVPGTTDDVVLPILEEASGKTAGVDFGVGMNPEFLREGEAVDDFMNPDRIVLGAIDAKTLQVLEELYTPFTNIDILTTNTKTAEMIKYASNSLLATLISFSNEIANLCAAVGGIDVVDVMKGVHLDKRLSPILPNGDRLTPPITTYIEAGCGFGGSCFPKDVKALIAYGKKIRVPMNLLESVISINEHQPHQVLGLLEKHFQKNEKVRVAILGLAFKPETDDMRESPAIPIIRGLMSRGASIKAYDPAAQHQAQKIFDSDKIQYCDTLEFAIKDVEAILLLTRWEPFRKLPEYLADQIVPPLVIDGRRLLDKATIKRYEGIGLGEVE